MKIKSILIGAVFGLSCISSQAEDKKQDLTIGLHLGSYHDGGNLNNFNPGLYVRKNNFVAGGYYNSIKRNSFYLGYMLETETPNLPLVDSVSVLVGGITGYPNKYIDIGGVAPIAIPSAKFLITDDVALRLIYIPKTKMTKANLLHFTIEKNF